MIGRHPLCSHVWNLCLTSSLLQRGMDELGMGFDVSGE